jgi:starch-binding outer membrane protein SusE/F
MKKILLCLLAAVFMLTACENDATMVMIGADPSPANITSHTNGFVKEITKESLNEVITFKWDPADYGVKTEVVYVLQVDSAGRSFSDPTTIGSTQTTSFSIAVGELNNLLLTQLEVPSNKESSLELRVVSTVRSQYTEVSSTISIKVKTLKLFDIDNPPRLWVPGGYQGWSPSTAPNIYGINESTFEGYVYIKEGTGFKFTSAPDWDHINYGYAGTPGKLTTDGLADGLSASEPGYYRFIVNVVELTYEMYKVETFGIIGTATPGGWDSSTPMVYDQSSGLWSTTLDLNSGALKFRANNDWWLNYGPENSNALSGKLIATNDAISIPEAGKYTITIDLSKSVVPRRYKYSVVKNTGGDAPVKLWIPGGYQASGGDPSQSDAMTIYAIPNSNDKVFEGYFNVSSATWIKFTNAADWGHTNYGSAGAGQLSTDGNAPGIDVPSAGYYKFIVNIETLTYSLVKINSWGLIGDATTGGWNTSTPMDFDPVTKTWSKTVNLVNGALKFRANDGWDINYGPADSNSFAGMLIQTDAAISISSAGSYTVTIDLNRTAPNYTYSYTVVKN